MMKIFNHDIPCRDCTDSECVNSGDIYSDCPKYRCNRVGDGFMNCEHCAFVDHYIKDVYYGGKDKNDT